MSRSQKNHIADSTPAADPEREEVGLAWRQKPRPYRTLEPRWQSCPVRPIHDERLCLHPPGAWPGSLFIRVRRHAFVNGCRALRIFCHDGTHLLIWLNAFTRYVYLPAYVCWRGRGNADGGWRGESCSRQLAYRLDRTGLCPRQTVRCRRQ